MLLLGDHIILDGSQEAGEEVHMLEAITAHIKAIHKRQDCSVFMTRVSGSEASDIPATLIGSPEEAGNHPSTGC